MQHGTSTQNINLTKLLRVRKEIFSPSQDSQAGAYSEGGSCPPPQICRGNCPHPDFKKGNKKRRKKGKIWKNKGEKGKKIHYLEIYLIWGEGRAKKSTRVITEYAPALKTAVKNTKINLLNFFVILKNSSSIRIIEKVLS